MGAMIGLVIGYAVGSRAGEDGWVELRDAWKAIAGSEEVRDLLSGGLSIAGRLMQRGTEMLSERIQGPGTDTRLRPVA